MTEKMLSALNPEQRDAVCHEGSPLLILAGAGSGKTRVITTKIAWLIRERSVDPASILAVTFTNKAAREMAERAKALDERAASAVIRTFHSFGAWFMRRNAALADADSGFTIYDDTDSVTLLSKAVPDLARNRTASLVHRISRAKDYCLEPDSPKLDIIDPDPEFRRIYGLYQQRLRETGNLDFGDLIMLPVKILRENEEVRRRIRQRFTVILVDEYQDSNVAQFELLRALTGENTYLCVVGDDDQSIYRFRGAEVQNILSYPEQFLNTTVIRLERNYRSVKPILAVADQVVRNNKGRLGKTLLAQRPGEKKPVLLFLHDQDEESAFCAQLIQDAVQKGGHWADWAVLYRTNAQSLGFETEFLHRQIPYRVVGSLKFYEREEIKDALAFLALAVNPRNSVAFHRVVNKPARGLGAVTQDKIVEEARRSLYAAGTGAGDGAENSGSIIDACSRMLGSLSTKAQGGLTEFLHIMASLNAALENAEPGDTLAVFIEKLIDCTGLGEYYRAEDEIAGSQRMANLQELMNGAALYPLSREGLVQFLEHIELDRSMEQQEESADSVTLITIHNTKGLEFPRVIMTGMEAGIFPRDDKDPSELEEERRLCYVGITRAKDELYLTSCASRRLYGKTAPMRPSLFLEEMEPASIEVIGMDPWKMRSRQHRDDGLSGQRPRDLWSPGQKLFHDDYGYGIIQKTCYTDGEFVVTVQFEYGEPRRFMPKYQGHSLLRVKDDEF
ncbi:MAG: UvrD-helicase domain-containing protein [Spirochaetaceae bacterium]|nr:UvrD-helicase domain-containing protein [Spirochaetaceae bacterium]